MMDEDVRNKISVLGADGVLDVLLRMRTDRRVTASELAADTGMHVATAVKRLNMLHAAGFLEKAVRKGKTRHADEYWLKSTRFVIELELGMGTNTGGGADFIAGLMLDILGRLVRFSGEEESSVVAGWGKVPGADPDIVSAVQSGHRSAKDAKAAAATLEAILDSEAARYGPLTVKALARASLESVESRLGRCNLKLPVKYFGGE